MLPDEPLAPGSRYRRAGRLIFSGWLLGMMASYGLLQHDREAGLAAFAITWAAFLAAMTWNYARHGRR